MTAVTLRLTSPHMAGFQVTRLQQLLTRSKFGAFNPGTIDGDYGPSTAAAVKRAKYVIGYRRPDMVAEENLSLILAGRVKVGYYNRVIAAGRKKAKPSKTRRRQYMDAVATWTGTQLGRKENPPGSNKNPYGKVWGEDGVSWCGLFVCSAMKAGGVKITRALALRWDYVPMIEADARANHNGMSIVSASVLLTGDLVCYTFTGSRSPQHVGVFMEWVDEKNGIFKSREGNTAGEGKTGSQSDGGMVAERIRHTANATAFTRIKV